MIRPKPQTGTASGKPFKLAKYFAAISLVVILLFAVALSTFMAGQSKAVILERYEDYALVLAANLNHQVFRQFVLPTAAIYGKIDLSSDYQYRRLDKVVRATIHSLNVEQINIYDLDGLMLYSTGITTIGDSRHSGPGFDEARQGRPVSSLVSPPTLTDYISHGGKLAREVKLETLTPFRADRLSVSLTDPRPVLGVFELVTDLTPEMEQVFKQQVLIGLTATGLMGLMFIILTLVVRSGEKILIARAEERKELEFKLQESERLADLGRMVASVSHEIKSPLGIIRSTGELLADQMDSDDPSLKLTDVIVEECSRLNRIVMEFLDFARPQVPAPQRCDIGELLGRNLAVLEPELDKRSITLDLDNRRAPTIQADPEMLYRALLNVTLNAVQAMPEGGKLSVSARPGDRWGCIIDIEDTGGGLTADQVERAFEPFFTLKEQGSGLGLAIVKSIVEAHDGEIAMLSRPGAGTRVTIRI